MNSLKGWCFLEYREMIIKRCRNNLVLAVEKRADDNLHCELLKAANVGMYDANIPLVEMCVWLLDMEISLP